MRNIDFSKDYKIEAIPSKNYKEFAEKGISIYPGCSQTVTAKWNEMAQRFVDTGLDEYAPEILRISDSNERKEIQQRIIDMREQIEQEIGIPNFLSPQNGDAWMSDMATVKIEVGQDLKVRVNNSSDNILRPYLSAKDKISYLLLLFNPKFPKSKSDISKPDFSEAKFYMTTNEEVDQMTKEKLTKNKKVYVELDKMFAPDANKQRALEVGYYLGLVRKGSISPDVLEDAMLKFAIGNSENLDKFIEAVSLDNSELFLHNLIKRGLEYRVISVSSDGYYIRGAETYGRTIDQSVKLLSTPDKASELAQLRSEVEKKMRKKEALTLT